MRDADITVRVSATADPAAVRIARMGLLLRALRDGGYDIRDFYKVLPDNTSSALPPTAAPATTAPRLYLQAGAFQRADEADNLKAQLALLGVEAVIQTSEVPNKGVLHRVRIGPFHTADEANRTRSLLAQNNIPVTLVKEVPTQQETP